MIYSASFSTNTKHLTFKLNDYRQSLWKRRCPPYSISIINHLIDKKYHGVKSFVCYEIQTEVSSLRGLEKKRVIVSLKWQVAYRGLN